MLAMTLSYFRPSRVDSKTSLPDGVDADVDRVEPGLDHPARDLLGDQRAVADHADFLDALLLGVAHLLDQLPVDERLAVVVHPDVRDAELDALVDDLPEQLDGHDALLAVHVVARAEHALRVADVGAFDLHDLGQDGARSRPVASSSRRTGFACWRSTCSAARARARLDVQGLGHVLYSCRKCSMTRVRISSSSTVGLVADQRADLRDVGHAPRHVLEPGLVGLVVRDRHDLGAAAGHRLDLLGELADRDFLAVADVEDLADGARLVDQGYHSAHDVPDVGEAAATACRRRRP